MLRYLKEEYRKEYPYPANPLSPKNVISDFEPSGLTDFVNLVLV